MISIAVLYCELLPDPLSPIRAMHTSLTALIHECLVTAGLYEAFRKLLAHLWRVDLAVTFVVVCPGIAIVVRLIVASPGHFQYLRIAANKPQHSPRGSCE
jgi:hypothetical protein